MVESWIYVFVLNDMNSSVSYKATAYEQWQSFEETISSSTQFRILDLRS